MKRVISKKDSVFKVVPRYSKELNLSQTYLNIGTLQQTTETQVRGSSLLVYCVDVASKR